MRKLVSRTLSVTAVVVVSTNAKYPREMVSHMDKDVNPCIDFYGYACGKWMESTKLKPSQDFLELSYGDIDDNNAKIFRKIVLQNHPIVGEVWDSCMAVDKLKDLNVQPLQNDLKRIVKAQTKDDILELAGEFSRTGTNAFTSIIVEPSPNNALTNTLTMVPAGLTIPSVAHYSNDNFLKISKEYRNYINNMINLVEFYSPRDYRMNKLLKWITLRKDYSAADIVIDIEKELASSRSKTSVQDLHLSITKVSEKFPMTFGVFAKGMKLLTKAGVKANHKMYVASPDYFEDVENMIKNTSQDDLKVYLAFVMVHSRASWLGGDIFEMWYDVFGGKRTLETTEQRFEFCLSRLVEYTPDLFGKHYSEMAFDKKGEQKALEIVNLIKQAMGKRISRSTWLSSRDQREVQQKLRKITTLIGQTTVYQSYPPILSRTDYPANIYSILSHNFDVKMKEVGQPVNRLQWPHSSAKADAYYIRERNTILFPTAILQPPLFKAQFHPAINFGGIGGIIGHEITHAFDNTGRFYDGDGNKRHWWDQDTIEEFKNRTQCMEKQYSEFEVFGNSGLLGHIDGKLTLDENIADSGGLALAWDAYRNYITTIQSSSGVTTSDDGDEMFFLAFGQTYCMKGTDANMRYKLIRDSHAPGKWRVNGAVMNNEAFATTFHCNVDTPMNPINRCKIW